MASRAGMGKPASRHGSWFTITSPAAPFLAAARYIIESWGRDVFRLPMGIAPLKESLPVSPPSTARPSADFAEVASPFSATPSIVSPPTVTLACRKRVSYLNSITSTA